MCNRCKGSGNCKEDNCKSGNCIEETELSQGSKIAVALIALSAAVSATFSVLHCLKHKNKRVS